VGLDFHRVFRSSSYEARKLRRELHSWLLAAGVNGTVERDVTGAVNEAFANAIEHPVGRASEEIVVDGEVTDGVVVVRIRDDGVWSDDVDPDRSHYGFELMETLMDRVEVARGSEATIVTLRRAIVG
jgi:anti-sigma regulatory factor (Ser/Thr protein kinase)